jgi:hypothetical protein
MPEVSRFYGIVIRIFFGDHPPPHLHAVYGEHSAKVDITTLAVFDGRLPARALSLVIEWATLHQNELRERSNALLTCRPPARSIRCHE